MTGVESWASWVISPWLILALSSVAFVYLRGTSRLRAEGHARFSRGREASLAAGLLVIFVAVASPLDGMAEVLLQAHMVQHWLLMMVAPVLVWLGWPAVPMLRGLPEGWLQGGAGPLLAWSPVQGFLGWLARPGVATGLLIGVILVWHWPAAYQLALRAPLWHDLEHACFFWAGMVFWYPVLSPWPGRTPAGSRLGMVAAFMVFNTVFSAVFAFSTGVFYPVYAEAPRLFDGAALADQNAAGGFMWVAGSLPMLIAAGASVLTWLGPTSTRAASIPAPARSVAPARKPPIAVLRHGRRGAQLLMGALAAWVVWDGFAGPQQPSAANAAGVLPWTYWRAFALLALLLVGNLFCGACPFVLSRGVAGRLLGHRFSWPGPLQNRWLPIGLLVFYLWAYEVFALWDSPYWTAWVVVAYFTASFLTEGLFARGTFCRYVCPIGQFQFVASAVSPRTVAPMDPEVCGACKTHDCLRGNAESPGCPTGLFLPAKTGGLDCTLCLDCAEACPSANVALLPTARGDALGLGRHAGSRPVAPRLDATALTGLFVFGAFANALFMVGPVESARGSLGTGGEVAMGLFAAAGLVLLPAALVVGVAKITAGPAQRGWQDVASMLLPALVPLAFAMWLAHFCMHFLMAPDAFAFPLERLLASLGWPTAMPPLALAARTAFSPELAMLGVGLVGTVVVGYRLVGRLVGPGQVVRVALPWLGLALALHGLGVWIFSQPMAMRGMLM